MDEFLKFVAGVLNVQVQALSADTRYGELSQWDSVMHLRLIMEVESEYAIDIPLDEIPQIKTLGQLYLYTQAK